MRPSLHSKMLDKAVSAMSAAVEIYNKPSFPYREESFSLLALNAWELLLKSRILQQSSNDPKCIRVYETRQTKSGKPSKKLYLKRNRTGNPQTITLGHCLLRLEKATPKLATEIKANILALVAIRDNSAHYISASSVLAKQVLEIASASVKNFVILSIEWFESDFSEMFSLFLPLSFIDGQIEIESVVVTHDESRLIQYLKGLAASESPQPSPYSVAVKVQVKLERSNLASSSKVEISKDPDAVKITLSEEDIRKKYPWDYEKLKEILCARYSDFKQNAAFHKIRMPLLKDEKFVKSRFLDPGNPKSAKKDFYNANVLQVFDAHYTKIS